MVGEAGAGRVDPRRDDRGTLLSRSVSREDGAADEDKKGTSRMGLWCDEGDSKVGAEKPCNTGVSPERGGTKDFLTGTSVAVIGRGDFTSGHLYLCNEMNDDRESRSAPFPRYLWMTYLLGHRTVVEGGLVVGVPETVVGVPS